MSNVAGEARGSAVTSKFGAPPHSGVLVHVVAVIRTVLPPALRRHRPSIVGAAGRACCFDFGNGAGANASETKARSSVRTIRRMAETPGPGLRPADLPAVRSRTGSVLRRRPGGRPVEAEGMLSPVADRHS